MAGKKIFFIYNPQAGYVRHRPGLVRQMLALLNARNLNIPENQILPTAAAGDATRLAFLAVEAQADLIIVCGGDGTINEVAQAVVGSKTSLAILPAGTANVLAKEMRLPGNPQKLADLIASDKIQEISVGRASKPEGNWSRYFLLMAGIGLDASIIEAVNPKLKKQWGIGSYLAAGLKTLTDWPLKPFSISFGQQKHEATFAIVANASNYAAWFTIAPHSQMASDHLNVCIFNSRSRLVYLSYAFLSLFGAHTISPSVIYEPITETYANTSTDTPVQLDGELVGYLPMKFECLHKALRIVA